ncbi:hypothetical protein RM780_23340 [Streptomyces sp. DSM 44917]|uniref:Uncharacterized protein n=1 Tax=Streptomyces boetiae TaxID=3075541 RepID=A0ABU2LE46_9ACTN|nr:hypothetical protein [Streptomyces sp. DSM 44917]MDT0309865.1 hypothetical protein [Streptomyces sp. DSM 44917]
MSTRSVSCNAGAVASCAMVGLLFELSGAGWDGFHRLMGFLHGNDRSRPQGAARPNGPAAQTG